MNPKSKIELEKKMNHIADYWIDMYQTKKKEKIVVGVMPAKQFVQNKPLR